MSLTGDEFTAKLAQWKLTSPHSSTSVNTDVLTNVSSTSMNTVVKWSILRTAVASSRHRKNKLDEPTYKVIPDEVFPAF